jgi:hypothetical protein
MPFFEVGGDYMRFIKVINRDACEINCFMLWVRLDYLFVADLGSAKIADWTA